VINANESNPLRLLLFSNSFGRRFGGHVALKSFKDARPIAILLRLNWICFLED
jgi:hypothetical protein